MSVYLVGERSNGHRVKYGGKVDKVTMSRICHVLGRVAVGGCECYSEVRPKEEKIVR